MILEQKLLIPKFEGPQCIFLCWSTQVKEFLKVNRRWYVVQGNEAVRSSTSHQWETSGFGYESAAATSSEFTKDVSCSIILQALARFHSRASWALRKTPEDVAFLHGRWSAITTWNKSAVHSTLILWKYSGQPVHKYVAKWDMCCVQLAFMEDPIDERLLMMILVHLFGD